jgi:hypothetical protein
MNNFGTWLVNGCGVSAICDTPSGVTYWIAEMVKRGGVPAVTRWAQALVLIVALFGAGQAQAANPMDLDQMTTYADNAILDAAQTGHKAVTLKFGHASLGNIERLTDDLRARGYAIDEETGLLNPEIVKVRFLKNSAIAKLEVTR